MREDARWREMTAYSVAAFHVITGVCVLAAVRHLSNGLWRPIDKANLLFSVMCCCAAGMAWTLAQLYQTWSIDEHAALLKWNISFVMVFFIVMPWFTSAVTGRLPLRWLIASTVAFVALLAVNLIQPVGLQLAGIERIETSTCPGASRSPVLLDHSRRASGLPLRLRWSLSAIPWFDSWRVGAGKDPAPA